MSKKFNSKQKVKKSHRTHKHLTWVRVYFLRSKLSFFPPLNLVCTFGVTGCSWSCRTGVNWVELWILGHCITLICLFIIPLFSPDICSCAWDHFPVACVIFCSCNWQHYLLHHCAWSLLWRFVSSKHNAFQYDQASRLLFFCIQWALLHLSNSCKHANETDRVKE